MIYVFRPAKGQPSVIGEKKFYAFATDVSITVITRVDLLVKLNTTLLLLDCKGLGVFVKCEVCPQRYCC